MEGDNKDRPQTIGDMLDKIQPEYVERGSRRITDVEFRRVLGAADKIRLKFQQQGHLRQYTTTVEFLLAMLEDFSKGRYRSVPFYVVSVATFCLLYVYEPADLISDDLPMIGHLDDAAVMACCVRMLSEPVSRYAEWEGREAE